MWVTRSLEFGRVELARRHCSRPDESRPGLLRPRKLSPCRLLLGAGRRVLVIHLGPTHFAVITQATQPSRLPSRDLIPAPLESSRTDSPPFTFGHLAECLSLPAVSVGHRRFPLAHCDQNSYRQILQPLLALGAPDAAWTSPPAPPAEPPA